MDLSAAMTATRRIKSAHLEDITCSLYEHKKFNSSRRHSLSQDNTDDDVHLMSDQPIRSVNTKTGSVHVESTQGIYSGTGLKMNLDPDCCNSFPYFRTVNFQKSSYTESMLSASPETSTFTSAYNFCDQYTPERNSSLSLAFLKSKVSKPLFPSCISDTQSNMDNNSFCRVLKMPKIETNQNEGVGWCQDEKGKKHFVKDLAIESRPRWYSDVQGSNMSSPVLGGLKRSANSNVMKQGLVTDSGILNLSLNHLGKDSLKPKCASFDLHSYSNVDTTKRRYENLGGSCSATIGSSYCDGKYNDFTESLQKENIPVDFSLKKSCNPDKLKTLEFAKMDNLQIMSTSKNKALNERLCNDTSVYNTRTPDKETKESGFYLVINLKKPFKPIEGGTTNESFKHTDSVATYETTDAPNSEKIKIAPFNTAGNQEHKVNVFSCWKCEDKFYGADKLNVHMKTVHNEDCSYRCEQCSRSFRRLNNLRRHQRVHRAHIYKCKYCDRVFNEEFYLKPHMATHTGNRVYSCGVCSTSFPSGRDLKLHVKTHSPSQLHTCNICNKSFSKACVLRQHKKGHTGERPYMCEKCQKTFVLPHHLIMHLRSHKNKKEFLCQICNKEFYQSSHLYKHLRSHDQEMLRNRRDQPTYVNALQNDVTLLSMDSPNKSVSESAKSHPSTVYVDILKSFKDQIIETQKFSHMDKGIKIQKQSVLNDVVIKTDSNTRSNQLLENLHTKAFSAHSSRKRMQMTSQNVSKEIASQEFSNQLQLSMPPSRAVHSSIVVPYAHLVPYNPHAFILSPLSEPSEMIAYEHVYNPISLAQIQADYNNLLLRNFYSYNPYNRHDQSHTTGNQGDQDERASQQDVSHLIAQKEVSDKVPVSRSLDT